MSGLHLLFSLLAYSFIINQVGLLFSLNFPVTFFLYPSVCISPLPLGMNSLLLSTWLISSDLCSRPSWKAPSLWSFSEFLQIESLLLALKLWKYLLYLCDTPEPGLYHFGPYITAFIELCSVIIPLAHIKNFIRNHPAPSAIEFTVWLSLGTWFATFHSVFSMLTHGKNVSQSSKPRIAGFSWAAVLFLSCGHHESCLPLFIGLEPKLQPTASNK